MEVNKALTEKEKKILETIAETLPDMTEAEKMYLLGQAEGMAIMKKKERDFALCAESEQKAM